MCVGGKMGSRGRWEGYGYWDLVGSYGNYQISALFVLHVIRKNTLQPVLPGVFPPTKQLRSGP